MKKKYVVVPGMVGPVFVGDEQLISLFGADPRECLSPSEVQWDVFNKSCACHYNNYPKNYGDLIPLRPQEDGDYSLEKAMVDHIRNVLINNGLRIY